ncbi:MAG: tripartite tricarboxylate transporter substrate binding protein [Betaproteobacteria bacterium]|nr:tripartite tricarboxylate transporter substrate binding protein [Betaproteobacteria bacterium]
MVSHPGKSLLTAALFGVIPAIASAQSFPAKPIRVLVPFPAGASLDLSARVIGQKVSESINQPVIIENRAGGNTIVAAEAVARAPADGYTLLQTLDTTFTLVPAAYRKIPYDPIKDFAPVTQSSRASYLIAGSTRAPYRSLTELVSHARANPGKINIGASTSLTQILSILLRNTANIDVTYVPYKGTPPMIQGLASGELDLIIDAIPLYIPGMKAGKTVALATTGSTRSQQLPDVPTTRELGFPQLEANTWTGIFAPAGTPEAVLNRLNAEFVRALDSADLKQRINDAGLNPVTSSTREEVGRLVKEGIAHWTPLVRAAGISLD